MNYNMKLLFTVSLIFSISSLLLSQESNSSDTISYKLSMDVSGARSSGSFARTAIGLGGDLVMQKGKWEFHENASYRYNNTNGRKLLDDWLSQATLIYHTEGTWNWFPIAIHQFENNIIYRVNRRNRFGLGLGAYPLDKNGYLLRMSSGWFYENEEYNGDTFINSNLVSSKRENSNLWFHVKSQIPLGKTKGLIGIDLWYFQSLKENEDYTLRIQPSIKMRINTHFSFLVKYDYRFENVYLESLVSSNDILLFGLNVKLGK